MKECCWNCAFMCATHGVNGNSPSVHNYYGTKDGTDYKLGKFDNYEGRNSNSVMLKLKQRCCKDYKPKVVE